MNAPLYVTPPPPISYPDPNSGTREVVDLLRQMIGLQQEQVGLLKTQLASQDNVSRWRSFLARWEQDFPNIAVACKQALPTLERTYLSLIRDLTDRVNSTDTGDLEDEFVLSEFLDRFGIRLGQLGNILSQLAPLAEAAPAEAGPATT
jgi:hypothetical protein